MMETVIAAPHVFNKGEFRLDSVFRDVIWPIYKEHQNTFDPYGIHGILHISRAVIAGNILAKQFDKSHQGGVSYTSIALALMFHDSGRKGNGTDVWEHDSAERCLQYLYSAGISNEFSTSSMIIKSKDKNGIMYSCVHDADVLEIMRPCTGNGGLAGFRKDKLMLYAHFQKFLDRLIPEWWGFIVQTETIKQELSDVDCMAKLLKLINVKTYPIIWNGIQ